MKKTDQKIGKGFLVFAGICIITLPFIVLLAFSFEPEEMEGAVLETQSLDFDYNGRAIFESYDRISRDYMEGTSTERTLSDYYSLRQYPGSPPFIPHDVEVHGVKLECLTCHADGGWSQRTKSMTPLTPHPELISCLQCHVRPKTDSLFRAIDWQSIPPPRLGRPELPGAPTPIPHHLQMRGNCIACHVGPGTVTAIRVEHPSRGNCRQCHVPNSYAEPFQRKPGF
jgi:cytochrome c-type protein NapB